MTIEKDRVLRLNCPGFGEESHLNLGRAKSLEHYQVIIANPVSLLHLFDKGPEATRRINTFLQEGINQLNVPDDSLIQELINESDARLEELIPFLTQGGLLVYFLCRPFILAGPSISVDNYDWLSVYAPSQKVPEGTGPRQMSAVSHGRVVEPTDEGDSSEMSDYLRLPGIEWNTIIRTDFLSNNYSVLATAGAKKCIAAQFWAGDKGGKVIFLPAPYSPDFDKVLMEGVEKWHQSSKQFAVQQQVEPEKAPELDLSSILASAQDSLNSLKSEGKAPLTESSPKQPPKGALKSLFADDDDDDDMKDDLEAAAPAASTNNAPAPVVSSAPAQEPVKVTAEDILKSVSMEAERLSKELESESTSEIADALDLDKILQDSMAISQSLPAMDAVSEQVFEPELIPEPEPIKEAEPALEVESTPINIEPTPVPPAPETASVGQYELKKATADMDLSEFAETAKQLLQQANEIESATREPGKEPVVTPKLKIETQALEAAENMEAAANLQSEEKIDEAEILEEASQESPFARPKSMLEQMETANMIEQDKAPAEDDEQNQLLNGMIKDLIGGGGAADEMPLFPASSPSAPVHEVVSPARPDKPATQMSMDEFRDTFEFLKEGDLDDQLSYTPEERKPVLEQDQGVAAQEQSDYDLFANPSTASASANAGGNGESPKSSLRSIVSGMGTPAPQATPTDSYFDLAAAPAEKTPDQFTTPAQFETAAPVAESGMPSSSLLSELTQGASASIPAPAAEPVVEPINMPQAMPTPAPTPAWMAALHPTTPKFDDTSTQESIPTLEVAQEIIQPQYQAQLLGQPDLVRQESAPYIQEPLSIPEPVLNIPEPALTIPEPAVSMPEPALSMPEPAPYVAPPPAPMPVPTQAPVAAMHAPPVYSTPPAFTPPPGITPPASSSAPPANPLPDPEPVKFDNSPLPDIPPDKLVPLPQVETPDSPNKDLMMKMEELTAPMNLTWTQEFTFPYVDGMKAEHGQMMEQLRQMQLRLSALDGRIRAMDGLKHVLLTGEQDTLLSASQEVLLRLGWTVSPSRTNPNELWLSRGDQIDAIARVVRSPATANRSEIAQLAESVIAFWDEYEIEPKGILIAQTWFSKPPAERTEPDFTPALQEFAGKKNLCLMSAIQLLAMYKDIEMQALPVEEIRKRMLDTNGRLIGFTLDNNVAQPAAV